ncbi:MAG TPA: hypothetical protein P5528_13155 [Steroidobacteraceae bacterium]|nr:hypothetical protein [Steroidobacteraceae bacterium]HRX90385.1 hypothetical protein [Steroidobacteraceae bacterium]
MNTKLYWALSAAALLAVSGMVSSPAYAGSADAEAAAWLGSEATIDSSEQTDHVPMGGKLTLIYDSEDDVYRACARSSSNQRGSWKADWAAPCGVTLNFVRGSRYCTLSDVKAGNAEVLSDCHRLRSREVAMHASTVKGGMELHDMIVFLIQPSSKSSKAELAILLDSPSRVTHNGIIHGIVPP